MSSVNNISNYLTNYLLYSQSTQQTNTSQSKQSSDGDSYVSSLSDDSTPLFSDTYNNLVSQIQNASSSSTDTNADTSGNSYGSSSSSSTAAFGSSDSVSKSGSSSGSSDSDSDQTTQIVTINGVTYLEITTTQNGAETVTRIPIGDASSLEKTDKKPPFPPKDEDQTANPSNAFDDEDTTNAAAQSIATTVTQSSSSIA